MDIVQRPIRSIKSFSFTFGFLAIAGVVIWKFWAINAFFPCLVCTDQLDLGSHERGDYARGSVVIRNDGRADLTIFDIRSSCSCAGLEIDETNGPVPVTTLTIPPASERTVFIHVAVNGPTGGSVTNSTTFQTNDPRRASHTIAVRVSEVKAGIACDPTVWVIGNTLPGAPLTQLVAVTDDSPTPRQVSRVEVSPSAGPVRARLLGPDEMRAARLSPTARMIAAVELVAQRPEPSAIEAVVRVFPTEEGRAPAEIPVRGRVTGAATVVPESLSIPRYSQGQLVYEGTCLCRSIDGRVITVTPARVPDGLSVRVTDSTHPGTRVVRVTADPARLPKQTGPIRFVIELSATIEDASCRLELPVVFHSAAAG